MEDERATTSIGLTMVPDDILDEHTELVSRLLVSIETNIFYNSDISKKCIFNFFGRGCRNAARIKEFYRYHMNTFYKHNNFDIVLRVDPERVKEIEARYFPNNRRSSGSIRERRYSVDMDGIIEFSPDHSNSDDGETKNEEAPPSLEIERTPSPSSEPAAKIMKVASITDIRKTVKSHGSVQRFEISEDEFSSDEEILTEIPKLEYLQAIGVLNVRESAKDVVCDDAELVKISEYAGSVRLVLGYSIRTTGDKLIEMILYEPLSGIHSAKPRNIFEEMLRISAEMDIEEDRADRFYRQMQERLETPQNRRPTSTITSSSLRDPPTSLLATVVRKRHLAHPSPAPASSSGQQKRKAVRRLRL